MVATAATEEAVAFAQDLALVGWAMWPAERLAAVLDHVRLVVAHAPAPLTGEEALVVELSGHTSGDVVVVNEVELPPRDVVAGGELTEKPHL